MHKSQYPCQIPYFTVEIDHCSLLQGIQSCQEVFLAQSNVLPAPFHNRSGKSWKTTCGVSSPMMK